MERTDLNRAEDREASRRNLCINSCFLRPISLQIVRRDVLYDRATLPLLTQGAVRASESVAVMLVTAL